MPIKRCSEINNISFLQGLSVSCYIDSNDGGHVVSITCLVPNHEKSIGIDHTKLRQSIDPMWIRNVHQSVLCVVSG